MSDGERNFAIGCDYSEPVLDGMTREESEKAFARNLNYETEFKRERLFSSLELWEKKEGNWDLVKQHNF